MPRYLQYTPLNAEGDPIATGGPHYLDLEAIQVADFSDGKEKLPGGQWGGPVPQVFVYFSISGLSPIRILDASQVAKIRRFIEGRSDC